MSNEREAEELLVQIATILAAESEEAVLAGGFASMFYRRLPDAPDLETPEVVTFDVDFVLSPPSRAPGDANLARRLLDADIVALLNRGSEPPTARYQRGVHGVEEPAAVYVEFLEPLRGSQRDRKGRDKHPGSHRGLKTQRLRYLDLLLVHPIEVGSGLLVAGTDAPVRIPHPCTYILQKALIRKGRDPRKAAKDLVYIFEAALLSRPRWGEFTGVVREIHERIPGSEAWIERAAHDLRVLFWEADADGSVTVARHHRGGGTREWSARAVRDVMRHFLMAVELA